ncbi:MAG: outer membrane beta-barrel protein [Candidatus Saganbacteria bacterium]|nr:outer membrane beta-barrel protein [Candidatus Saganbacteria bacterium]
MNKSILSLLLIAAILAAIPCSSAAAERSLDMISGIGAGYYYLYPKDIQIQNYYHRGMAYKAFLELLAESGLSAGLDISYYSEGNMSSTAVPGTTLTIIPITASVSYHLFKGSTLSPYFGAGVGEYFINESDPDFNYLTATKFGKHIFAGADIYFTRDTILRAEIRQTFIDPVNSTYYYQANFGGLTASIMLAIDWPVFGRETRMTTEEIAYERQKSLLDAENQLLMDHVRQMQSFYSPQSWDSAIYQPWNSPTYIINNVVPSQQQLDDSKAKADQLKADTEQKRQQYIQEKTNLRQEKKGQ